MTTTPKTKTDDTKVTQPIAPHIQPAALPAPSAHYFAGYTRNVDGTEVAGNPLNPTAHPTKEAAIAQATELLNRARARATRGVGSIESA